MNLFANRLLTVFGLISVALLFQITISSNLIFATERPDSNTNKTSFGFGLEPNVTNGSSPNQLAYRNSQHGISMLFPSNWTYSDSGLPEYTQIAAFYGPLQNLSDRRNSSDGARVVPALDDETRDIDRDDVTPDDDAGIRARHGDAGVGPRRAELR